MLLAFVVLLAFASIVSTLLLREVLSSRVGDRVDDALAQEVDEFRRLVGGRNPQTGRPFSTDVRSIFEVFLARNVPGEGEAIHTFVGGRPFRSSRDTARPAGAFHALEALAEVPAPTLTDVEAGELRLRALAVPVVIGGVRRGTFLVTHQLSREEAEVDEAVRSAAIVSAVALLLALGLGFVAAGRVLRPLRDMTDTARAIGDTDLERRIPVEGSDEVAGLGHTFNAMLDRLQAAFDAQRTFLANAGHELRTPITIVRGHLELLGDDPAEREQTIALVEDELVRMTRLVDDLLTLAKAERPDFLRPDELDLDVLTDELFAKASGLDDRAWELERVGAGRLRGDRQRLTQAVMNLALNAVHATGPGDRIALGSEMRRDGEARIWVSDSGAGVPPEAAERIFERFVRGTGGRRGEGSGLGLAIIAEAHGGTVELDAGGRGGATFVLTLPTDTPPEVGLTP